MKKMTFIIVLIGSLSMSGFSQKKKNNASENSIHQYWFVMLTKGPLRNQDSATAASIQIGHLANINRLYKDGKLKVAGPFGDDGDWLGLFIFDCKTKEEVDSLLQTDPAVKSGRLLYDVRPWYTAPVGSFAPGKPTAKH